MNRLARSSRILIGLAVALAVGMVGAAPVIQYLPWPLTGLWPIAGMWAAAAWSASGLSIRAMLALTLIGLHQDFIHDAPLGAWPLAFMTLYGCGLAAHRLFKSVADRMLAEILILTLGFAASVMALAAAGDIAGGSSVISFAFLADISLTAALYLLVRPVFEPEWLTEGAR